MRRGSSPRSERRSGPVARPSAPCAWSAPRACARGWPSARSPDAAPRALRAAGARRPPGSSASRIARTTTIRSAPAATTEETFSGSMPPIANQGIVASLAAYSINPSPVPGRPSLVGVAHTGPTLIWSGRSGPVAAQAAWTCSREWVESPTSASGPASRRASATGRSSWPTWTPSAPQAATRSGRSLRMNSARCSVAARRNGSASAISSWAERRDFSRSWTMSAPPSQGRVEQRTGIAAQRKALADEVEARRLQGCGAVDRGRWPSSSVSRSHGSTMERQREPRELGLRGRHPGRRPSEPDPGNAGAGMVARTARPVI